MPQEQTVQQRYRLGLVRQSSIRDLNVVQAYIWLCCLENSFSTIEQKLFPACLAVFSPKQPSLPAAGCSMPHIVQTIARHLDRSEQQYFSTYADRNSVC